MGYSWKNNSSTLLVCDQCAPTMNTVYAPTLLIFATHTHTPREESVGVYCTTTILALALLCTSSVS
jgi:hypothetical protein